MKSLFPLLALGLFTVALPASAAEPEHTVLVSEEKSLGIGERIVCHWKPPGGLAPGTSVFLGFDARIDAGDFTSGGADALQIRVNRMPVSIDRLANKPFAWIHGTRMVNSWQGANDLLKVLYHRWEDEAPKYGRLHRYVFDITTLLDRKQTAEIEFLSCFNGIEGAKVELRNVEVVAGGEIARHPFPAVSLPLYPSEPLKGFRDRAASLHSGVQIQLDTTAEATETAVNVNAAAPLPGGAVEAQLAEDGTVRLATKPDAVSIALNLGLPKAGWQRLGAAGGGWRTERSKDGALIFSNESLRVERRAVTSRFGVEIRDRIVNLSSEDLPVGILYEAGLGEIAKLKEFRLFGRKRPTFNCNTVPTRESATIPSAFFRSGSFGSFALLVEDDVLRNQASYLAWEETFGFGTDLFYLPPKGEHEFSWSFVSVGDGGYYDFLNKTRERWKTFQEIPGLFGFVYPRGKDRALTTPEKIAAFFEQTGISNPCIPPSAPVSGTGGATKMIYGNEREPAAKAAMEDTAVFIKLARDAGIKAPFLVYTDPHLIRTDGNQEMLDELSDSLIRDGRNQLVEYREGWLFNLLPTEKTSAGARFLKNLGIYLGTPEVGGVFLDEWDHSKALYSFNHSDGCTAQLNSDFTIRRKIGIVPLLIRSYQETVFRFLEQQKAVIYANQFDSTVSATRLPIVHFAEPTQYDSYFLFSAQLGRTPLALTVKRSSDPWLDTQEFLKLGVLTCFYAKRLEGDHLLRHLYPFTAKRLGPGYVVGDGRIVTLRSGSYSFGDARPLEASIFGGPKGTFLRKANAVSIDGKPTTLSLELEREAQEIALIKAVDP